MDERRFDNLTRVLATATSRRGMLKGLLGGLAAAVVGQVAAPYVSHASVAGCDSRQCEADASAAWQVCMTDCNESACRPTMRGPDTPPQLCNGCKALCNADYLYAKHVCDQTGCMIGLTCCGAQCVQLQDDTQNCGDCGHVCPSGFICRGGECVCPSHWPDHMTQCGDQCVDLQTDKQHCGSCDHPCKSCEGCFRGVCIPLVCPEGQTCCKEQCVPLCLNGDQPDPTTCQCNICKGQMNGAACDANNASLACCNEQCVDTQCPNGKQFSFDTCSCQCPPKNCPSGQLQDPDTCQCVNAGNGGCPPCQDLDQNGACAPTSSTDGQLCGGCGQCSGGVCVADVNRSCQACYECQPDGTCAPVPDNTSCGGTEICCQGVCITGTSCGPCPPGEHQCPPDNAGNQACCADGLDCCAGEDGGTSCGGTNGVCCPIGTTIQCGTSCCDAASEQCLHAMADETITACCPSGSVGLLPDGTCCPAGQQLCGANYDVCCPSGQYCSQADNGSSFCCPTDSTATDDGTCCPNGSQRYCETYEGSTFCCPEGQQCLYDAADGIVSACCPPDSGGLTPEGTCCSSSETPLQCADGSWVCCSGDSTTCCAGGTCPDQQSCFTDCCDASSEVCLSSVSGYHYLYCCPTGSSDVLPDGTCCTSTQSATVCADNQWVCCDQGSTTCCDSHGGNA